jgi:hypothetical protein
MKNKITLGGVNSFFLKLFTPPMVRPAWAQSNG